MSYRSPAPTAKVFKMRGTWKLEGNKIIFEHFVGIKAKAMDFTGTVRDKDTIVGEALYKGGNRAAMTLKRTTLPK
jgi:hypothetical protein